MPLQDLTPQLRTRLNRVERAVGWFTFLATALLLFGFGYYVYSTAKLKGWTKVKAPYYTYADSAKGLKVGDPVELLGFAVGKITRIDSMPPRSEYAVFVSFEVDEPYYNYILSEGSKARLVSANLLSGRIIEVTKGSDTGHTTFINYPVEEVATGAVAGLPHQGKLHLAQDVYSGTNIELRTGAPITRELLQKAAELQVSNLCIIDATSEHRSIESMWDAYHHRFVPYEKYKNGKLVQYELQQYEEPALSDRAQALLTEVEKALPNFLAITNRINAVLSNSANLTSNLNVVAADIRPTVSNLSVITANLSGPRGSLGEWLIPTNIADKLDATLGATHKTVNDADTNLVAVAENLERSLNNLADITSNLNHQVEVNSNILTHISDIIVHTDQFVQGLKHHWLLRSAFKTKPTNSPPARTIGTAPARSPRDLDDQ